MFKQSHRQTQFHVIRKVSMASTLEYFNCDTVHNKYFINIYCDVSRLLTTGYITVC